MPYKDPEKQRVYQRDWQRRQRLDPEYREKHRQLVKRLRTLPEYQIRGESRLSDGRRSSWTPIGIRRALLERADGKCEGKDPHECKGKLGIHHLDGDSENNELSNLLLACNSYHVKGHGLGTEIRGGERDDKGRFARSQTRSLE